MSSKPIFKHLENSENLPFLKEMCSSNASRIVKMIFSTHSRYLKYSPNFKEYVSRKLRVVRPVEMKISKETQKGRLKKTVSYKT